MGKYLVFLMIFLSGCSTMDSFGDKGNCKATIDFECDCDCSQSSVMSEAVEIIK